MTRERTLEFLRDLQTQFDAKLRGEGWRVSPSHLAALRTAITVIEREESVSITLYALSLDLSRLTARTSEALAEFRTAYQDQ